MCLVDVQQQDSTTCNGKDHTKLNNWPQKKIQNLCDAEQVQLLGKNKQIHLRTFRTNHARAMQTECINTLEIRFFAGQEKEKT